METERIILRNFENKDLYDLHEYSSQLNVGEMAGWAHHDTIEQSKKMLKDFVSNKNLYAIVLKENNKVIGHIGVYEDSEEHREDTKELGYVLNKNYWNKGVMTAAINMILEKLFSNNIKFVYACCFQNNAASKHLIEKCGFKFEQEGTYYSETMNMTFDSYEYVFVL